MAKTQQVEAPDGRKWEIRSYRYRWPSFFPFASSTSGGGSVGAFFAKLLFALVLGVVFWLIAALLKALVHPFRRSAWVDAVSVAPERTALHWKTRRGSEDEVAAEVAEQLRAGSAPQPRNAEER
jgi:hypothetical protein